MILSRKRGGGRTDILAKENVAHLGEKRIP